MPTTIKVLKINWFAKNLGSVTPMTLVMIPTFGSTFESGGAVHIKGSKGGHGSNIK